MRQGKTTPARPKSTNPLPVDGEEERSILSTTAETSANISRELTNIYQEPDGTLPDMKNITVKKSRPLLNFLIGLLVLGVLSAGLIWAKFLWWTSSAITTDALNFSLTGPSKIAVGATTTYTISYINTEKVSLHNATLNVYAPDGFVFLASSAPAENAGHNEWRLGTIPPYGRGAISITGRPYGDAGSAFSWRAFIHYQPEKFNSTLEQVASTITNLTASEALLSLTGPAVATVGSPVSYSIKVKNFQNIGGRLAIKPSWPGNFNLTSSSPALVNGAWALLTPPEATTTAPLEMTYKITGAFTSASEVSSTPLAAALYTNLDNKSSYRLAESAVTTAVENNDLSISLAINGTTKDFDSKPGEMLTITLQVKNNSARDIKNAALKLVLDAPSLKKQSLLDWAAISDPLDGTIIGEQRSDSIRRGTIVWTSKQLPALARLKPGAAAIVDLRLPIKSTANFDVTALGTSTISALGSLVFTDTTGANQSLSSAPIGITCSSDLAFESQVTTAKNDQDKTQFNVNWLITNSAHELQDVVVSASLFGDITFAETASSSLGSVVFNQPDKNLLWTIPKLPTSLELATLPFSVVINKRNPSQTILISKVHITAKDAVTGKKLDFLSEELPLATPPPAATP